MDLGPSPAEEGPMKDLKRESIKQQAKGAASTAKGV
jgi:hypothetical protein